MSALLEVADLAVTFPQPGGGVVRPVDGVSFALSAGEAVGIVGASGAGKTLSALAVLGLVPLPGRVTARRLTLAGQDVLAADEEAVGKLRGRVVGYLSQETGGALNPLRTVGFQVVEAARLHHGLRGRPARLRAVELLGEVGLEEPERVARSYPHELSGGQRQRALLAAALAADPRVLVADEPTSALDTVSQARLLALLSELRVRRNLSLLLISHDLAVVSRSTERVVVLYAGETVEEAPVDVIFSRPGHPYSQALLASVRGAVGGFAAADAGGRPAEGWPGCRFEPHCPVAFARCRRQRPALVRTRESQSLRCFLHHQEAEPRD